MKALVLCLMIFSVSFNTVAYAERTLGVFAGLSLPTGEFGDTDIWDDESGFAAKGICIGAEIDKPLTTPGLTWMSSATISVNPFDTDALEDEYRDEFLDYGMNMTHSSVKADGWIVSIPLLTGIRYQQVASPTIDWFGFSQIGFSYVMYPDVELDINVVEDDYYELLEVNSEGTMTYDSGTALSFVFGGGVELNKKWRFTLRYCNLGTPEVKAEQDLVTRMYVDGVLEDVQTDSFSGKIDHPTKMILLTASLIL